MTGKRDIQPRLKQILAEAGFRVAIMRSRAVKTRDRLDWIEKEGKRNDIVISHPQLVQTRLDFFGKKPGSQNLNAIALYQTGYQPFTMQQAARRAWRTGQSKDCRVYYLHYRDTMQQRAMAPAARKMAAIMALDGRLSVEELAGMDDDESAAMALARSISDAIDSADIQRNLVKVASNRGPASSPLLSFGEALLEDEPIDGLDILAIEPHLIAQEILDTQENAGDIALSREVLARMLAEFDTICDQGVIEAGRWAPDPLLQLGIDSLEEDPFDELYLLKFEPALICQTLLDHEAVSPTVLSGAMLAKMAEELFAADEMLADLAVV